MDNRKTNIDFSSISLSGLEGIVTTGFGDAYTFISIPTYQKELNIVLGTNPYPGTLNLIVDENKAKIFLSKLKKRYIKGFKGKSKTKNLSKQILSYGGVTYYLVWIRAKVKSKYKTLRCAIIVPKKTRHPKNIIEVISTHCIRERFKLNDGDIVILTMKNPSTKVHGFFKPQN
ncbi:MAG: DUF120 domain-containing protein [Nanoarchaeota archaeon]